MARTFPPPRRKLTSPIAPLPEPAMPTAAQYTVITNLGIAPSWRQPWGRFADEMHYRGDIDQMIDAISGPANTQDCEKYNLTANEWHTAVSESLAHAAFLYKCTLPYTEDEIEILVDAADASWRPRLRELMIGGVNFVEAVNVIASEEEAVTKPLTRAVPDDVIAE